jgi:hypothetical protein
MKAYMGLEIYLQLGTVLPVHAMKAYMGLEIYLQLFFTCVPDGD